MTWITVQEYATIIGRSESTARFRIKHKKIESKMQHGRRLVFYDADAQVIDVEARPVDAETQIVKAEARQVDATTQPINAEAQLVAASTLTLFSYLSNLEKDKNNLSESVKHKDQIILEQQQSITELTNLLTTEKKKKKWFFGLFGF
jgi:hypothetical protein